MTDTYLLCGVPPEATLTIGRTADQMSGKPRTTDLILSNRRRHPRQNKRKHNMP
jgi:hypothetical protein